MTDLDIYQPAAAAGYQPGMVMDEKAARALDEQVRACTKAVLREGTDYGHIPGTNGEEKSLWRPGAQKLLQWFGLSCSCERVEVERDGDGRKHGITYRATVARRLPDGSLDIKATCEGTADYDEKKFYKTAEQVQRDAEDRERFNADKYRRVPRPTKWQGLPEYRADWNALMKRAQKRAIVGAVVDATAAGGIFSDREEDDHDPAPENDGPSWYEQAIEAALTFTDRDAGAALYTEAAQAHRDGLCTRRQQDHIQNRITQRARQLKTATPVEAEDLGRQAEQQAGGGRGEDSQGGEDRGMGADRVKPSGSQRTDPPRPEAPGPAGDQPARATTGQLSMLGKRLGKLGVGDENRLGTLEKLAGRDLAAAKELTQDEAAHIRGLLDRCDGDRGALVELLATGHLPEAENPGGGDE